MTASVNEPWTPGAAPSPQALKDLHRGLRQELADHVARGDDGLGVGRLHAQRLDEILRSLFERARRDAGDALGPVALAAVGSYGRGAVAIGSDADVRVIVAPSLDREVATGFAEALFYPLWDGGFPLGHQLMDVDEALRLAQTDVASATTLLDLRFVAGDASLVATVLERAWRGLFDESALSSFVGRLEAEAEGRHARFGGSVYLLEPDVKSGAGGLRDLDGARWAARARFKVGDQPKPEAAGGAGSLPLGLWSELVRLGVLVTREAQEIHDAEQFLWRVRNRLHLHAGRRSDRLTFDQQEAIALELGYAGPDGTSFLEDDAKAAERATAAEKLMQDYYLHARVVSRARERLLERATPARRRGKPVEQDLGRGVHLFDGQATIAGSQELAADPALALRVYATAVRLNVPVLPFAREAIARAAADPAFAEALRASPEAAEHFIALLCTVSEAKTKRGSILAELHDVGLLLAMIPEFRPVTGRVHHDVYHVFTVDVHSVAAVDYLRAIARGELAQSSALASRLAAEIARPRPLFLATLLHDVGKGYPDANGSRKSHARSGAELCDVILPRLGLAPEEVSQARFLVLQHLAMYHAATRRDLDDPGAIEEFCKLVEGREALRELYLLTVADLSTTSPTAMTSWKARMLDELYFAADAYLAGGPRASADDERLSRVRDDARRLWTGDPAFFEDFLATMPDRYFVANGKEDIVAHAAVARARQGEKVTAALVPDRHIDVAQICVVAEDRPGLLARLAAAMTANKLEVLAAQVYSRAPRDGGAGEAVDLFWVRDRTDGEAGVRRAMPRLLRDLKDVCNGTVAPADLLRARTGSSSPWAERRSPPVTTEVVIDDRASPRHTVIEVFAKDRPGLLYTLANTLHDLGLQIALSKINTEGTKVADVFYVNELDGSRVKPGERFKAVRETLFRAVSDL